MANEDDDAVIMNAAVEILARLAEIATMREAINEIKGDIKGMGINLGDFNFALKKFRDEPETRDASFANIGRCLRAMDVSYEPIFPSMPKARKAKSPATVAASPEVF